MWEAYLHYKASFSHIPYAKQRHVKMDMMRSAVRFVTKSAEFLPPDHPLLLWQERFAPVSGFVPLTNSEVPRHDSAYSGCRTAASRICSTSALPSGSTWNPRAPSLQYRPACGSAASCGLTPSGLPRAAPGSSTTSSARSAARATAAIASSDPRPTLAASSPPFRRQSASRRTC